MMAAAPVAEPTPVVAPVDPMMSAPVVEPTPIAPPAVETPAMPEMMPAQPEMVAAPAAEPTPVIYGGASPIVTDINVNQDSNHQIYGGADPLQNTQTIPAVAPVASVEPVVTSPVMTPEMAPVAPVAPATPSEVAAPTVPGQM